MKKILRILWLAVILLVASMPLQAAAATPFKDVKSRHWASQAIQWAYKEGLASGYSDGTFRPDQPITESQLVTMLVHFDCTSKDSFPSKKGEHKAMGNYRYLGKHFLPLKGLSNKKALDAPIRNDLAARIIAAYQGFDLSNYQAVFYLYSKELANGTTGKNDYEDFGPSRNLTRAEAVNLLYRMSQQNGCKLKGLTKKATGSDNYKYAYPENFVKNDEQIFERPVQPPVNKPKPSNTPKVDIEQATLVANGKDSTFITFTFKDASGDPLPYDEEIPFTVKSSAGAGLDEKLTWKPGWDEATLGKLDLIGISFGEQDYYIYFHMTDGFYYQYIYDSIKQKDAAAYLKDAPVKKLKPEEMSAAQSKEIKTNQATLGRSNLSISTNETTIVSDGPEVIVKVTAPPATENLTDTITVSPGGIPNGYQLSSGSTTIKYESKAELQLETDNNNEKLTATLVYPGGSKALNFNGYLEIEAPSGVSLSSNKVEFYRGEATVYINTPGNNLKDTIRAKAVARSSSVDKNLSPAINKWYNLPITFTKPISINRTCTAVKPEIAFVLDSSGSMKQNDPRRERIKSTREFINALNTNMNITTHFNTAGIFLDRGIPSIVTPGLNSIGQKGGTSIANGMSKAFSEFKTSGKKVVVLLTDGKSAKAPILQQVAEAQKRNIRIFTIGLGKGLDHNLLERIAKDTGGAYFSIDEAVDLTGVYQSILDSISCDTPPQTCPTIDSVFQSPLVEMREKDFLMTTDLSDACGEIGKVIVRFTSLSGDLDYELLYRGQNYYTLTKGNYEINDFLLLNTAKFLAYDKKGNLLSTKTVLIKKIKEFS